MPIDSGNYAGEKKAPVDDSRIAKSADLDTEGILKNSMLNEHLKQNRCRRDDESLSTSSVIPPISSLTITCAYTSRLVVKPVSTFLATFPHLSDRLKLDCCMV